MKRFSLILVILLLVFGYSSAQTARRLGSSNGLPATCNAGPPVTDVWYRADTDELYVCTALNTWTRVGTTAVGSTQTANTVFSGPTTGAAALPTFRALVSDDVPSLDTAKVTTGTFATARVVASPTNSRCLRIDGSGNIVAASADCASGAGTGDVVGPASSVDGEIVLFDLTTGKLIKRATGSGFVKATSGVYSAVASVNLAADVTGDLPFANLTAASAASKLLGRGDSGAGDYQEITIGSGLTMTGTTLSASGGSIAPLVIEDANTVAQRNGATGQTLNVYGTFTDAANYSRLRIKGTNGGAFEIKSENAGTGGLQTLEIGVGGTNKITIGTGTINPTHLAYDLGGSGNRWSIVYAAQYLASTSLQVNASKLSQTGGNGVWTLSDTSDNPGTWAGLASSPSQFTADQNDYAMPHFAYLQRWSSDASRTVTGISKSQISGQVHLIVNVGSFDIVLAHESASSAAANRFLNSTGANITLTANQAAEIIYDTTTQRWRAFKRN